MMPPAMSPVEAKNGDNRMRTSVHGDDRTSPFNEALRSKRSR